MGLEFSSQKRELEGHVQAGLKENNCPCCALPWETTWKDLQDLNFKTPQLTAGEKNEKTPLLHDHKEIKSVNNQSLEDGPEPR
jgi:hypothetical protein